MNAAEWEALCQTLDATFIGDLVPGGAAEAALARYFGRVPADLAAAAVDRLVADGQAFMPRPGEFMRALRRVVPDSTFGLAAALRGLTVAEYVERSGGPRELAAVRVLPRGVA